MMTSSEIREAFLHFFDSKKHKIVASAPMVIKNDPTLMFTNAGMNQFKDIFLGNTKAEATRVTDSQKCLRVSGKHNDLEAVGHDTYHHTMFEMLGNWSFGDYFKEDAINWAWEFLVDVLKLSPDRLYASVFEGSADDNLTLDNEAKKLWESHLSNEQILNGSKKDNFWEMGETGPCGPCSEVHIDLRPEAERAKISGADLVNKDHPLVIEIWNLVFIQYNRKANGVLENLPQKHIDTGMGFERLAMAVQGKTSNYDTDVFQPIIQKIAKISGYEYNQDNDTQIAMRVIADHLRTIAFSIADGQLPSNAKAGYVIRRILRRAVRYAYTFLNQKEPFIFRLLPSLIEVMGKAYPELETQKTIIGKVIKEEEAAFLRTLEIGIKRLDQIIENVKANDYKVVNGEEAFELYDTYGFPLDLTELILKENGLVVSKREFDKEMEKQKNRSRQAATQETDDWVELLIDDVEEFIGYDFLVTDLKITRYRKIKELFQLVFNYTPFYAESGGQVGDTGFIEANGEKTSIIDTKKENNLIIHLSDKLPSEPRAKFKAQVNGSKRKSTERNHSATHLVHHAMRHILGNHVEQKGSLVDTKRLRFDFAHFQKLSPDEIQQIEQTVNREIRKNTVLTEKRTIPIDSAKEMGAVALFGEKYGDIVRVVQFGDSIELCGGTHVQATGEIGYFKIVSESAIAAGIRRIEAITGDVAEKYIESELGKLKGIAELFKNPKNLKASIEKLLADNNDLTKKMESFNKDKIIQLKKSLIQETESIGKINFIAQEIELDSAAAIKDMAFQLKGEIENLVLVLGAKINNKANLTVMVSDNLVKTKNLNANAFIKQVSKEIKGGGGGQPFYATAGGSNPAGIKNAIAIIREKINSID